MFFIINIDDDMLDIIMSYNISWEKLKYWISCLVFSNFDSRKNVFGSPNGTFRWELETNYLFLKILLLFAGKS